MVSITSFWITLFYGKNAICIPDFLLLKFCNESPVSPRCLRSVCLAVEWFCNVLRLVPTILFKGSLQSPVFQMVSKIQ